MTRHPTPHAPAPVRPADGKYTAAQAAVVLDVPVATVVRWERERKIQFVDRLRAPVPGGWQRFYLLAEIAPLAERYHRRRAQFRAAVRQFDGGTV